MIDLYTWQTPNGRKVSIMLEEIGLDYKVFPINISKDEQFQPHFLEVSPNNRIPAIVDKDNNNFSLFVTRPTLFSYIANRDEYNLASFELYSRVADGRLKVAIHDKMPIENIVEAHNLLEGRKTKGAIVITL